MSTPSPLEGTNRASITWNIRELDPALDSKEVQGLDTSSINDFVYQSAWEGDVLRLVPVRQEAPRHKGFAIDLTADAWTQAYVATENGKVRAIIAVGFGAWNSRMSIWHFYVDRPFRNCGAGRLLLERAIEWGRQLGAVTAWAETSNTNHSGIVAYRKLGFEICGFDLSLYQGTPAEGEFALYLSRDLAGSCS